MRIPSIEDIQSAFSKCEVVRRVGDGGAGAVFLVRISGWDDEFALKILLNDSEQGIAEFKKEGAIQKRLSHPNVVKVFECGVEGGFHYLLMEYCEERSLLTRIAEMKIDDHMAANLVIDIAKGLSYVHSKGIIHRDVKPENVMMSGAGVPKLVDFGLAHREGEDRSKLAAIGSEGYAAPEIWNTPERASVQSDIYAMGALLYTVLTERLPDPHNVNFNHLSERDPSFIYFIVKAMAQKPEKRHQSMEEFIADLEKLKNNLGRSSAF